MQAKNTQKNETGCNKPTSKSTSQKGTFFVFRSVIFSPRVFFPLLAFQVDIFSPRYPVLPAPSSIVAEAYRDIVWM
jgi:hypothetical protein